jgi:hypothetical protein
MLLYKGNIATIVLKVYNTTIKLKVIIISKVFTFLSYKLSLLQLELFEFYKIVIP